MGTGLYIHVPFCLKKCPYCDFYSLEYNDFTADEYVSAVLRNIGHYTEQKNADISVDTIYFGGGTPSLLKPLQFDRILQKISSVFSLACPEISLEANPGTVTPDSLKNLYSIGFNRISFGVQSFSDYELKILGRLHDSKTAENAIKNAFNAGFENISADIMLGIIGQDINSLDVSLDKIRGLPLTHVSAYMLKIERGTPYDTHRIYDKLPDEDTVSDLYIHTMDELEKSGFAQYEISNLSRCGCECKHNLHYWRCEEYIGIGPSAHSYFGGKRFGVPRSVNDFIINELQTEEITDENPGTFSEYGMLKLRLTEGVDLNFCKERYGIDIQKISAVCKALDNGGFIKFRENKIKLTRRGCLVSNQIISRIFL